MAIDMKIMICGSMAFIKDILNVKKQLDRLGHTALIPHGTEPHLTDNKFVEKLGDNLEYCIKNNIMKKNFDMVARSDAILVLNPQRNKIEGYIGVSVLMEMAVAHHLNKNIFIFNGIPHYDKARWSQEVRIMQPVIIHGNLNKIK